jgi:hypothetical protein
MGKYKPIFVFLSAGMLYYSYVLIDKKNSSKLTKAIFWICAALSIVVIYLPTYVYSKG